MFKRSILLLSISAIIVFNVFAGGLSSNWGEVVIANLESGKSCYLNEIAGAPFAVTNNFQDTVPLIAEIVLPQKSELKKGYEILPSVDWVKINEPQFEVGGSKTKVIDLIVTIPSEGKYAGKKYQFWVWTHTAGKAVGVGLKSRILINIRK